MIAFLPPHWGPLKILAPNWTKLCYKKLFLGSVGELEECLDLYVLGVGRLECARMPGHYIVCVVFTIVLATIIRDRHQQPDNTKWPLYFGCQFGIVVELYDVFLIS